MKRAYTKMTYDKVLVTGGTGFVGRSLKKIRPNWIYLSSGDCDLADKDQCFEYFIKEKPDAIIHLAARTGGIKENVNNQAEFFYENIEINTNVIHQAYRAGIKRVLSALSTCCFPDVVEKYPFSEEDMFAGPPAASNLSYGFSKRALYVQSNSYRKQYGLNYSCFSPCNLYGPDNNFDFEESHFMSSMIRKFYEAKDGDTLEFWGSGAPLRQHMYVDDLSRIICLLLDKHNSSIPIIVSLGENMSIKRTIEMCSRVIGKDVDVVFNDELDGQYRKDGDNRRLLELVGNYKFTSLEQGIRKTYEWYEQNH